MSDVRTWVVELNSLSSEPAAGGSTPRPVAVWSRVESWRFDGGEDAGLGDELAAVGVVGKPAAARELGQVDPVTAHRGRLPALTAHVHVVVAGAARDRVALVDEEP